MRIIAFCLALLTAALPAVAQDRSAAIEGVISGQLDAFNDRDIDTAWSYASPMIKGMFGTPENFRTMVETGYPMVWTNSDARFMDLREMAGGLYQRVMVKDANGVFHILEYRMIETADGWQIDGVSILPAPDVGA